jgi:hypothetical protein
MSPIDRFAQTLPDDDPVRVYIERVRRGARVDKNPDDERRIELLGQVMSSYGVREGTPVAADVVGALRRLLAELAKLYASDRPGSVVRHDLILEVYEEHSDNRGWESHTVAVPPRDIDQQNATRDDEEPDEPVAPPARRCSAADLERVLDEVAADETAEGRVIIASVRRLIGAPADERPDVFMKNGKRNVSAFGRFIGPGAPAHRTITRVLDRIRGAGDALPRVSDPMSFPTIQTGVPMPLTLQPASPDEARREEADSPGIPEAMLGGLSRLWEAYGHRLRYPHDDTLRTELGYLCAQLGRRMATDVYELLTRVDAVAPGQLPGADPTRVAVPLRAFLREVMSGDIARDPDYPLLQLMTALRTGGNVFTVGEAAVRSAVALLGLKEFGGVFAAWQLQAIGFTLMTWDDHVSFNERILEYIHRDICRESAARRADEYLLPGLDYLVAGCRGNVVNASYRIALTDPTPGRRDAARAVGDQYLDELERSTTPAMKQTLLLGGLQVTRAACAAALGDATTADRHWSAIPPKEVPQILIDLERTEPCVPVRERVLGIAREVFRLPPDPEPTGREERSGLELARAD